MPASAWFPEVEHAGAGDLGGGPRLLPGERHGTLADGEPHQLVPGRMEVDPVDAVAKAVVAAQLRHHSVRRAGQFLDAARSDGAAGLVQPRLSPTGSEGPHDVLQCRIGPESVVIGQRRRLVQDLVGRVAEGVLCDERCRHALDSSLMSAGRNVPRRPLRDTRGAVGHALPGARFGRVPGIKPVGAAPAIPPRSGTSARSRRARRPRPVRSA